MATAGVMLSKGPQARRYTQKAVHTQGGTNKRRPVATAGVMLFKGPRARCCTQKAVHTQGGLWPPQESCYLRGHKQGGTHRRRCTHKAEHTKGGLCVVRGRFCARWSCRRQWNICIYGINENPPQFFPLWRGWGGEQNGSRQNEITQTPSHFLQRKYSPRNVLFGTPHTDKPLFRDVSATQHFVCRACFRAAS